MVCQIKIYFFILILTVTYSQIASRHRILDKNPSTTICSENNDCPEGAECAGNKCQCSEEDGCMENTGRAKSTLVGGECTDDQDCNLEHAQCTENKICECKSGRVASADQRKCLKVAGGLDQRCDEDIQCMDKVKHSVCKNGKCACDEIHRRNKLKCLRVTDLDGACQNPEDCSSIEHSECKIVKCACVAGYVPASNKKRCLPEANNTSSVCEEDSQCAAYLGKGGICSENECDCDEFHHKEDDSTCVRYSKLKQPCETSEECSHNINDTMFCENGKCECLLPYYEKDGVCNGALIITASLSIFLPMLHIIYFMHLF